MSIRVEAVLTSDSISRKAIAAIMNAPVSRTLICGVLNFGLIRASAAGRSWSLLIAIGEREAASQPSRTLSFERRGYWLERMCCDLEAGFPAY